MGPLGTLITPKEAWGTLRSPQERPEHEGEVSQSGPPKQQQAAVAIFQSHKSATAHCSKVIGKGGTKFSNHFKAKAL